MSDPPTSHKPLAALYWSLLVTTALAAAIMVATFWLSARNESDDEWVLHTLAVRSQLAEALTLVQRAESGQRGYLLTGNEAYLVSYDAAVERLPAALDQTSRLVDDDQQQQQALEQLRQLIADKLMEMNETVEDRKAARSEAALEIINTGEGRRTMDEIRQLVTAMDTEEDRLLRMRQASAAGSSALLQWGVGATFVLICLVGALIGYFTRRSFGEVAAARDRLMAVNSQLLEQVQRREQAESQLGNRKRWKQSASCPAA